MKRFALVLLAPLFSTAVLAANGYSGPGAQPSTGYTGPGAQIQVTTVAQALKAGDDTPVVLQGQITKRLNDEMYQFKDATGTIEVEIDDELWPAQAVSETATVRLTGEVDRDLVGREIDVEYLEVIQ
ncbi:YgiW/YdeI family stress tolerance OB fold protein [Pseudomonas sp. TTU2014-080ASC]|uniref:YgiW/YdeI family stress tolerance OB fold protein n=1 Tax=Pseudomonas sp. TTU2014-080ASC TaxID=1729724 RepID=UPI0007189D09|nr:NirD/YgiW/YdeI family stress tolerance protein [Pseudomonas sp. TTU2014-080ASC]KRW61189.1 stress-induced protein YgiW [Pseudomonas sp. TTU2014-080ASC]